MQRCVPCNLVGGDGGLEGLGGPGVPLGSPDKKKRKAAAQGSCFPPPSEYAPPPNPSADHLVAANPFDDNYNTVCYKPLPSGNPYFANPSYPGFGGYNTFRMPPHLLTRMSSQYGASYPLRGQPHPFPQNPVGVVFSRPQAMNFGPHENVGFGNQPSYHSGVSQNIAMPGQHFRPIPGENFGHMPSQNTTQVLHHEMPLHFVPGNNPSFNSSPMEANPPYGPLPNNYSQSKPMQKPGPNKHGPPPAQHHQHGTDEAGNADLKPAARHAPAGLKSHPPKPAEALNSGHANGTQNKPPLPRGPAEGGGPEKGGQLPLHPAPHGPPPSEPVYPCGICTHEVNDDQDAILCEAACQKWFHRICTGMTESAYGLLTAEASAVWGCDTCMADKDVQLMRTRETGGPPVSSSEA
ncbi:PREDICTED: pygopus homolog 1 [Gekko japonicus]|uniref:Pygopus homolog 1 n=1 Tax=Gekko japonicus TaxID=146911 RepID=A0ABM1JT75_GEKJA|nr:PREDICTED: pygopus homolog 1 [Gekko japonicus]